jgi:hypothetical protein
MSMFPMMILTSGSWLRIYCIPFWDGDVGLMQASVAIVLAGLIGPLRIRSTISVEYAW